MMPDVGAKGSKKREWTRLFLKSPITVIGVETAFSGKVPRWNKVKISALIRLMTENSTIITRKFTPSLTSNDTNISQ
jgi:hypothetical protein